MASFTASLNSVQKANLNLLLVCGSILAGAFVVSASSAAVHFHGLQIPAFCPFFVATGLPCPGCGLTRSVIFAVHGDFLTSLKLHIWGIPLAAVLLFQVPYRIYLLLRDGQPIFRVSDQVRRLFSWFVVISLLIQWLVKLGYELFS